jgi:hypothetical protein
MSSELLTGAYDYYEIFLDGEQARAGLNGYSSLNWPQFRLGFPLENVAQISVLEVIVPTSYYVFNSGNNTFSLTIAGNTYTVTITPGNYDSTTITTALQTALTNAYGAVTWTVVYTSATNKLTVSNSGPTAFVLTFGTSTDTGATNPRLWLGYNAGANSFAGTVAGGVAPNVINLSGWNFVYVNSQKIGTLIDAYTADGVIFNGNMQPVMARATITANSNGVSFYVDPSPEKMWNLENLYNLQEIDIYITTPENQIIDFNGMTFAVKIGIIVRNEAKASEMSSQTQSNRVIKRIRPQ